MIARRIARADALPGWRCFHCDANFTDAAQARTHFGRYEHSMPLCQVDAAEYRRMEKALTVWQSEDTELHREINRLAALHPTQLMAAEEAGYAKGLQDARRASNGAAVESQATNPFKAT